MNSVLARVILITALLAGCASVQLDPRGTVATTVAPFNAQLGVNRVYVPVGSQLAAALIDDTPAFCTVRPAYFAIGEARGVCLTDTGRTGVFDRYYVLGTLRSLTYAAHIPYTIGPPSAAVPQSMVTAADVAECSYQAQMATIAERGIITPAVDTANLRALCLQARGTRRAEGPR